MTFARVCAAFLVSTAGLVGGTGVAEAAPAPAVEPSSRCVATIVADLFRPSTVVYGQTTHMYVAVHNCTSSPLTVRLQTYGNLVCEVLDPIILTGQLAADQTKLATMAYQAPSCAGTATVYAQLESTSGTTLSTGQASFTVVAPPPA